MLEFLKIVAEQILSSIDILKILDRHRQGKFSAIGAELFELYMLLHTIYDDGVRLVDEVEYILNRPTIDDRLRMRLRVRIPLMLRIQQRNLTAFLTTYQRLHREFHVVTPRAHSYAYLVTRKFEYLSSLEGNLLSAMMDDGRMFVASGTQIENLGRGQSSNEVVVPFGEPLFLSDGTVPNSSIEVLRVYITERSPREQLAKIRTMLEGLHFILVENFTAKELLLKMPQRPIEIEEMLKG